jgi:hypothetical protein
MPTELERIATLEAQYAIIPEMAADVKIVVAYVNQQKGKATLMGIIWTGLVAIAAGAIGLVWHK